MERVPFVLLGVAIAFYLFVSFMAPLPNVYKAGDSADLHVPKRYVHPFPGKVIVKTVEMDDDPGEFTYAYTYGDTGGFCVIYVNRRYRGPMGWLLKHEIAHCNGWVHG